MKRFEANHEYMTEYNQGDFVRYEDAKELLDALEMIVCEYDGGGKVWLPFDVIGKARAVLLKAKQFA